ncbi:delta-aminolevulinic acid dehydratase [Porphyromonas crevioricanis]|uniref:Delta-aminolevulinic acid dehydratase n=2 Tax=Porphyromonas crevioricanis TaxID=393921 RepID=A0A0A2FJT4_9PORP|nr:porphobilinogen synthase [Porphyromonas crevioricanis]KGN90310.1 delta-aminolevulinic acid dehydratase [Porphyromonas crevioricanis]KGN95350.1 delta-aminolevulinic acid dehydratase [Porphyromonas crevioricanis]SJZ59566.1 porphobilinogen synthase [Porphyromonas crevioricanis]SQH72748.1 Delta-aminolevulinic acid dehydratase [Porphyromonas crevioricanis]GAD05613.1 porphobilinogen synthase [Porphyromonas crevioricanis JCM 15906]
MFPETRLRRLRSTAQMRAMVRETALAPSDFIAPLFVVHGQNIKEEISAMPGQYRFSIDRVVDECRELDAEGVSGVMLFGIPEHKDATGSEAYSPDGIVQQGIRAIKKALPHFIVIADICMCEYTDHGHCGIIHDHDVDNDATLEYLCKQAVSLAQAGVDMVAPSDMMDGRIKAMRKALDENGYTNLPIMAYSAKFSSAFYGPFREAADSAPSFGDRRSYQMDPANANEAIREIRADIEEGADIVMVKPALPYLDIIRRGTELFDLPMAAYHVSGEYAMVKAAAANGWIDEDRIILESLISIKRAGAKIIITYFAKDASRLLNKR